MPRDPDKKDDRAGQPRRAQAAPQSVSKERPRAPDRPWKPVFVTSDDEMRLHPGVLLKADVVALHAVWNGVANADQQRRAMLAVHKIASTDDMSYRPDDHGGERDSNFAEGKRYVGLQMRKLVYHHNLFVQDDK